MKATIVDDGDFLRKLVRRSPQLVLLNDLILDAFPLGKAPSAHWCLPPGVRPEEEVLDDFHAVVEATVHRSRPAVSAA